MRLTLATRRSALALAQSRAFAKALTYAVTGLVVDELQIVTSGDRVQSQSLQDIGGKGLFVKELEEAILDGRADFAVHSLKDVPGELAPGLRLAAIPEREDPRDVLVSRNNLRLADLPPGARVGTSSLRRALAIRAARPDLIAEPVRGNVDTRLRKVQDGTVDAIVLALAGLRRLGWEDRVTEVLPVEVSLPAVGQGALGIECRADDESTTAILRRLSDLETEACVAAERGVMIAVEGSCRLPVAAHAMRAGGRMRLLAMLAEPDGTHVRTGDRDVVFPRQAGEAEQVGRDLGRELRSRGPARGRG